MSGTICNGTDVRYQARGREFAMTDYELIGKPTKSFKLAAQRMASAFVERGYKRADVITWAEYYDPQQVCELVRR